MRKERSLGVFQKRVLRRIFGPKRGVVTGEWRKLHKEKLQNLYSSPKYYSNRKESDGRRM